MPALFQSPYEWLCSHDMHMLACVWARACIKDNQILIRHGAERHCLRIGGVGGNVVGVRA